MKRSHKDSPFLGGEWPKFEPKQPDSDKRLILTIALVAIVLSTALMLAMLWR